MSLFIFSIYSFDPIFWHVYFEFWILDSVFDKSLEVCMMLFSSREGFSYPLIIVTVVTYHLNIIKDSNYWHFGVTFARLLLNPVDLYLQSEVFPGYLWDTVVLMRHFLLGGWQTTIFVFVRPSGSLHPALQTFLLVSYPSALHSSRIWHNTWKETGIQSGSAQCISLSLGS